MSFGEAFGHAFAIMLVLGFVAMMVAVVSGTWPLVPVLFGAWAMIAGVIWAVDRWR